MNNIQKYTRWLQIISFTFAFIMFAATGSRWLLDLPPFLSELYVKACYDFDSSLWFKLPSIPFTHRLIGLFIDSFALGIICAGIIAFNRLMNRFREGDFFTSDIIQLLNTLSKLALCWAVYNPLRTTLLSVVTTLHKGVGSRIISVELGTKDIINVFIFICLILITALMQESFKLKKEQDLTI